MSSRARGGVGGDPYEYGWTISSSATDPYQNSGILPGGPGVLYLWYERSTADGVTGAEFGLGGDLSVIDFVPMNGFLNAGTATNLLLAVGGCPTTARVAGQILLETPVGVEGENWGRVKSLYRTRP